MRRERAESLGRPFLQFWWASSVSFLGDGMYAAALPLLAVSLTSDEILVAFVGSISSVPWLVLGLVSGALVDRWDRLRLMWVVDLARFALVAGLAVAVYTGHRRFRSCSRWASCSAWARPSSTAAAPGDTGTPSLTRGGDPGGHGLAGPAPTAPIARADRQRDQSVLLRQ